MNRRFALGVALLLGVYIFGGVGYKIMSPETSYVDCLYMSVITVASVGFSEVVDNAHRPELRAYTMVLILFGMAVHLYAVSVVTAFVVEGDLSHYFWRRRMARKIESMNGHYVVCGAGETGMRIIEELIATKRDFVVIDSDEEAIANLQKWKDIAVVKGLADDEEVLEGAGIRRASAAAVALKTDRDNLVATLSIRTMNPKIRIVVKELESGMANRFRRAGADSIVNPAAIGGLRLVSEMVRPSVVSFLDLMLRDAEHAYRVEELPVVPGSKWNNVALKDIPLQSEFNLLVAAIRRSDSQDFNYNPTGSWILESGQTLIVLGAAADVKRARDVASPA
jgi:voltage-gated potassium channel